MKAPPTSLLKFSAEKLLNLNDKDGKPFRRRADLDIPQQRQLLSEPRGSAEYLTYALLLRTHYEAHDFRNAVDSIYTSLSSATSMKPQAVEFTTRFEKQYLHIDFMSWEAMIIASEYEEYWIWRRLVVGEKTVGYVWFKEKTIMLFTDQALIFSGNSEFVSLLVYSLNDVYMPALPEVIDPASLISGQEPQVLEQDFEIYCKNLQMGREEPEAPVEGASPKPIAEMEFIRVRQINFLCLEKCAIEAIVSAISVQVKSSRLIQHGLITSKKQLFLLAKQTEINGSLQSETDTIFVFTETGLHTPDEKAKKPDKAPGESKFIAKAVQTIGIDLNIRSEIYTDALSINGNHIIPSGTSIVDGDASIVAADNPGVITTEAGARLFITGKLYQHGRWSNQFNGLLRQIKLSMLPTPEGSDAKEQPECSIVLSSDNFLSVTGRVSAPSASVALLSNGLLYFSGSVWATTFFANALAALEYQGYLVADGPAILQAGDVEIGDYSYIQAAQLKIEAKTDLTLQTTTIKAGQVSIQSGGDSKISEDQSVIIESESPVTWHCHNFYNNKGRLDVPKLQLRADHLTYLSPQSTMLGQEHHYEATYIISLFNRLSVKDQLSLSGYVSVLLGSLISSNNFINNSLFNLSISLYLPASLELSWPGLFSVAIATANSVLSGLRLAYIADPVVQTGIMISGIILNSIPALYNLYQQARQIQQFQRMQDDRVSALYLLQSIKTIVFTMASLAVGGYMASLPHPAGAAAGSHVPSIFPHSLQDALNKLDEIAANWLSMFPGERNNSLINLHFGVGLGLEQVSANLIDISSGFFGFISAFHSSALRLDPGTLNLQALSASSGARYYQFGSVVPLPFGSHSYRYKEMYSDPLFPLPQRHLNIVAQTWTTPGSQQYIDSSIQTEQWVVPGHSIVRMQNSHLTARIFVGEAGSREQWLGSQFQIDRFTQNGVADYWQSTGKIKIYDISKSGSEFYFYSSLTVDQLHERGVMQVYATQAKLGDLTVDGLFAAEAKSDVHGETCHLGAEAKVGSRTSSWNFKAFADDGDIPPLIDADDNHHRHHHHSNQAPYLGTGNFYLDNHQRVPGSEGLHYTSDSSYTASLTTDGMIIYSSPTEMKLKNEHIIAATPIGYQAPTITISGHNSGDASLTLISDKVVMQRADNQFSGGFTLESKHTTIDGGKTTAGAIDLHGIDLEIKNGAKVIGKDDVIVNMEQDVSIEGRQIVTTQVSEHDHCLFFTDKTTKKTTTFDNALLASADGQVSIHAHTILQKDADIAAEGNIYVDADQKIDIDAAIGHDTLDKSHSNFFGNDKSHQDTEVASGSHIDSKGIVTLHAGEEIHNRGGSINAAEIRQYISSPTGKITNESLILNRSGFASHTGFSFQNIAGMTWPFNLDQYTRQLPLVDGIHGIEFVGEAGNFANQLLGALRRRQMMEQLQQVLSLNGGLSLHPALSWQFGTQRSEYHDQFVGPGSFSAPLLDLDAKEAYFLNDFAVDAKSTHMRGGELHTRAAELRSSSNDYSSQIGLSTRLFDPVDVSFSHSAGHESKIDYQGSATHFGDLDIHASLIDEYGTTLDIGHLTGHVDSIVSASPLAEEHRSGYHLGFSYGGSFSFGCYDQDAWHVTTPSPLVVDRSDGFSVDQIDLTGQILPEGVHAGQSQLVPLYDVTRQHSFNFSMPWRELVSGQLPVHEPPHLFSFIHYDGQQQDHKIQHGGTEDGRIWRDYDSHLPLTIPIYHPQVGREFLDNLSWLGRQWQPAASPVTYPSVRKPQLPALHQYAHLHADHHLPDRLSVGEDIPIDFVALYNASSPLGIRVGLLPGALPYYSSSEGIQHLYRGAAKDIDEAFNKGFTARGENVDLFSHAMDPEDYLIDSAFISTSLDKDVASTFPKSYFEIYNSYLYEIYSTRPTIDVAKELMHRVSQDDIVPEDFEIYRGEQERAFVSKIFPYEIKGAWEVNVTKERVAYLEDLSPIIASWSPEAIDEICHTYHRTVGEEFISNPNFISPSTIERVLIIARSLGCLFTGVGLALDGRSFYHEFQASKESGNYDNTYREGVRIGGGWVGAWGMGSFYAETGVAICVPLTPVGQAVCGLGMGLVGSALGYYGGSAVTTKIYDVDRNHRSSSEWQPSFNTPLAFFKPSEWIQRQEKQLDSNSQRLGLVSIIPSAR